MTPGYLAPELISDVGSYLHPTKASDIYSFSILAYEVAFIREPWPAVNMQLIESVRRGIRPVVPNNASTFISSLLQNCWKHDSSSRPSALYVSQSIQDYLELSSPQIFVKDISNINPGQSQNQSAANSVVIHHSIIDNVASTALLSEQIIPIPNSNFSVSAKDGGSQTLFGDVSSIHSDNNGASFNSNTQGNEIPQDSHRVTADLSESPSDSLLSTHNDYALEYNECVAPSESSTDGFDSISKQVLCSSDPSTVVSPLQISRTKV